MLVVDVVVLVVVDVLVVLVVLEVLVVVVDVVDVVVLSMNYDNDGYFSFHSFPLLGFTDHDQEEKNIP